MRCIGTLGDDKQLETFVAYLITQNILSHVEREGTEPRIWIKNEDQVAAAKAHLDRFIANPNDPEFANAVDKANEIVRAETKKRAESRKLVKSYSEQLRRTPFQRAPLTISLIGLCAGLWFVQWFDFTPTARRDGPIERMVATSLFRALIFTAVPPAAWRKLSEQPTSIEARTYNISRGEVWRLVTPIFIHFGAWHLILNVLALYQLGVPLEERYGSFWLAAMILIMAVVSNSVQMIAPVWLDGSPLWSSLDGWGLALFGGISGVVFGLLGLAWIRFRFDWNSKVYVPRSTILWAVAWIVLGFSPLDFLLFGVNFGNWAHLIGFVAGIGLGYLSSGNSPLRPVKPRKS